MATIVLRAGLGRPLSFTEVDSNFNNLNTEKIERTGSVTFTGAQTFITGGASFPSIRFNSALTSGLFSPGTDQVGIATAGVSRMEFSAAGNVTINPPSSGNYALTLSQPTGSQLAILAVGGLSWGGNFGSYTFPSIAQPYLGTNASGGESETNVIWQNTGAAPGLSIGDLTSTTVFRRAMKITRTGVTIDAPSSGTALTIAAVSATTAAIDFSASGGVTTVGAAGGASALPATPVGYVTVAVAGTNRKIPYYNI